LHYGASLALERGQFPKAVAVTILVTLKGALPEVVRARTARPTPIVLKVILANMLNEVKVGQKIAERLGRHPDRGLHPAPSKMVTDDESLNLLVVTVEEAGAFDVRVISWLR
jgi:hypothetical protein